MKKITFLLLTVISFSGFSQNTVDFEASGIGVDWSWVVDQNGSNPALEFVTNPNTTGGNTTAVAAKFVATNEGETYALTYTDDMGAFTFTEANSLVKIMVLKSVSSVVALKFEDSTIPNFSSIIEVTNSVTNGDWEELTFNFGTSIGNTYDRMVIIPDFFARPQDHIVYFDQISFNLNDTLEDYNLEDIDFNQNTKFDFITNSGRTTACQATVSVNYNGETVTAKEQAQLRADVDMLQSCEIARANAIQTVATKIGKVKVESTSELNCDESNTKLFSPQVGEVAEKQQFKRDKKYTGEFQYQGTQCIWFNDIEWRGELHQANGIACQVSGNNYVVVDKF